MNNLTKPEIIKMLKERNIEFDEKSMKADLLNLLEESSNDNFSSKNVENTDAEKTNLDVLKSEETNSEVANPGEEQAEEIVTKEIMQKKPVKSTREKILERRRRSRNSKPRVEVIRRVEAEDKGKLSKEAEERILKESKIKASLDPHTRIVLKADHINQIRTMKKGDEIHVVAIASYGQYQIIVPYEEFFIHQKESDTIEEMKRKFSGRINQEFNFIVNKIIEQDGKRIALASRLDAMAKLRKHHWFKKDKRGEDIIKIGDIVEARVVAHDIQKIWVEVYGSESPIHLNELSYTRINTPSEAIPNLKNGMKIEVMITDIQKDEKGNIALFRSSYKKTREDERLRLLEEIEVGDVLSGQVTGFLDSPSGIRCFVRTHHGVDCLCQLVQGLNIVPTISDDVTVKVDGKDASQLKIWGRIVHIVRK